MSCVTNFRGQTGGNRYRFRLVTHTHTHESKHVGRVCVYNRYVIILAVQRHSQHTRTHNKSLETDISYSGRQRARYSPDPSGKYNIICYNKSAVQPHLCLCIRCVRRRVHLRPCACVYSFDFHSKPDQASPIKKKK